MIRRPPRSTLLPYPPLFRSVTRGTVGTGCQPKRALFARGPLNLSWGFSGSGQQLWIVHGLVSDEVARLRVFVGSGETWDAPLDRKSTRLNSSHANISYAVFC